MKKVIGFNLSSRNFEIIESEEIAIAMLSLGNTGGINRIVSSFPQNTCAILTQEKKSVISIIAPNGETITSVSNRNEAKAMMKILKNDFNLKTLNRKKNGGIVEIEKW